MISLSGVWSRHVSSRSFFFLFLDTATAPKHAERVQDAVHFSAQSTEVMQDLFCCVSGSSSPSYHLGHLFHCLRFISPFHQSELGAGRCIFTQTFLQRSSRGKYQKSRIPLSLSHIHAVETRDFDTLLGYGCLIPLTTYTKQTYFCSEVLLGYKCHCREVLSLCRKPPMQPADV